MRDEKVDEEMGGWVDGWMEVKDKGKLKLSSFSLQPGELEPIDIT
jgi:hypothetical protein